jgi:hypothetical protein
MWTCSNYLGARSAVAEELSAYLQVFHRGYWHNLRRAEDGKCLHLKVLNGLVIILIPQSNSDAFLSRVYLYSDWDVLNDIAYGRTPLDEPLDRLVNGVVLGPGQSMQVPLLLFSIVVY